MIRVATAADPLRVAVLASGRGSNLVALLDRLDATAAIVAVASDNAAAPALERAREAGIETAVFAVEDGDRAGRDGRLADWLVERGVELVVLAGFMQLLTEAVVERLPVVNVHPSLLPAFPGLRAWEQALAAGVPETGVTVHFVDRGLDTGPVIAQEPVPVRGGDTPDALHERIQAVEHRLLPDVVMRLARDEVPAPEGAVA
ncbi:MAG: phosphoribosylglycinamide formyltransferase [Actinobacteria bacterium]|nr:phosphoribosylglycinamide formyltransferase [Actinomycetota bacterium]